METQRALQLVDHLIEICQNAPELCTSCQHLAPEPIERFGWDKWCSKLITPVVRVTLCTGYDQKESE